MHEGVNAGLITTGQLGQFPDIAPQYILDPDWVAPDPAPASIQHPQIQVNKKEGMINSKLALQHKQHGITSASILWEHLEQTFRTYGATNACNMWQQIVATHFSRHHTWISSELAQLDNLINEYSAQEIIPARICAILILCMMPKSWEEMWNILLHMHHNNLAQLTPDVISQVCQIATTSCSFSIAHEALATLAKQSGIQKGGNTPKWNKQNGQNGQGQQQPK
ncbi:hypothetical protein P691DRAFT_766849 [Macrolepiota fuliginosa MF-IS2]|uniref:Uncharacterized protein n=1 Tax=Macrolepiota fuliginosa MF-IS2 TaxID=1400762 RepID=A0A9P6BVR9_9AGAR|nr:hypothetical protein P691DRAFT_766849 [Macrolepiota fuliginosa MF-IS2]